MMRQGFKVGQLIRTPIGTNLSFIHTTMPQQCNPPRMEKTINQVTLLGRVGGDPQKRGNQDHPVVNFSLATHHNYKYDSGDVLQRTDWHRVSVFKPSLRDTVFNYVKKGQRLYVTGKISYGEIKSEDGQVRTASTIIADDVIFFNSKPLTPSEPQESQEPQETY